MYVYMSNEAQGNHWNIIVPLIILSWTALYMVFIQTHLLLSWQKHFNWYFPYLFHSIFHFTILFIILFDILFDRTSFHALLSAGIVTHTHTQRDFFSASAYCKLITSSFIFHVLLLSHSHTLDTPSICPLIHRLSSCRCSLLNCNFNNKPQTWLSGRRRWRGVAGGEGVGLPGLHIS